MQRPPMRHMESMGDIPDPLDDLNQAISNSVPVAGMPQDPRAFRHEGRRQVGDSPYRPAQQADYGTDSKDRA